MAELSIMATMTGENFMPVRIHYRILKRSQLLKAFKTLRCLAYESTGKRWVWLLAHEAKRLPFEVTTANVPDGPIVLGSFQLRGTDELLLDVRSQERAVAAIPFFHSKLPRGLVKVEHADIVNQFYAVTEANVRRSPTDIFDAHAAASPEGASPMDLVRELIEKASTASSPAAKLEAALKHLEAMASASLPPIERIPIHFEEEGIDGFKLALNLRQIVAMNHWKGNHGFTLNDAIKSIHNGILPG